jgi:hypothetical protein
MGQNKNEIPTFFGIECNGMAFDIAIALYTWLAENHGGKSSLEYQALSSISYDYQLRGNISLDEMSEFYYNDISQDNWQDIFEEWKHYMDNEWDKESA